MKIVDRFKKSLLILAVGSTALVSQSGAVTINVDLAGINITNLKGNSNGPSTLVPLVWQGGDYAPSDNSAATRLDWLNTGGTYDPGQIQGYNLITSSSLGQAGANVVDDGNASGNAAGYSLTAGYTYYFTAHFGGSFVAWAVNAIDPAAEYTVPTRIGDVSGADSYASTNPPGQGNYNPNKGLSNVRAWQGSLIPGGGPRVPDSGTTLISLGVALLGLGSMRRLLAVKA